MYAERLSGAERDSGLLDGLGVPRCLRIFRPVLSISCVVSMGSCSVREPNGGLFSYAIWWMAADCRCGIEYGDADPFDDRYRGNLRNGYGSVGHTWLRYEDGCI